MYVLRGTRYARGEWALLESTMRLEISLHEHEKARKVHLSGFACIQ